LALTSTTVGLNNPVQPSASPTASPLPANASANDAFCELTGYARDRIVRLVGIANKHRHPCRAHGGCERIGTELGAVDFRLDPLRPASLAHQFPLTSPLKR